MTGALMRLIILTAGGRTFESQGGESTLGSIESVFREAARKEVAVQVVWSNGDGFIRSGCHTP